MTSDQTDQHWQRERVVRNAFGSFSNLRELSIQFVDVFAQAGAIVRGGYVQLRVPHDWAATVLAAGLCEVRYAFPLAAEPVDAGRPDVDLHRGRCLFFSYQLSRSAPDQPWLPDGERRLEWLVGEAKEVFLARTPSGRGTAFHPTASGAVIRAMRARGRDRGRARSAQPADGSLAAVT